MFIAESALISRKPRALFVLAVLMQLSLGSEVMSSEVRKPRYPPSRAIIDVKMAPYFARGDGRTDDTEAIQRAINENVGKHRLIHFPAGTYVVSKTLTWPKQWVGKDNWGFTFLRGEGGRQSVIRLKDGVFAEPGKTGSIMWCGGFGSADWFHNYVEDLGFDVGRDNPGATGLEFYSNNSGGVRNCRFVAPEGSGAIGLDLGHRDMNGSLLVKNCEVEGFRIGIRSAMAVNSQTFEFITLRGQTEAAFENQGQPVSIRRLVTEGGAPAVKTYGTLCLIEAKLTGLGEARNAPAILNYNGGRILLRDVTTSGFKRAVGDVATPDSGAAYRIEGPDKPGTLGPVVSEYSSTKPTSIFPSSACSLGLTIEETPEPTTDDIAAWANVDDFGADPSGQTDSAAAIQRAVDSGATTLFLPGHYALARSVVIREKVRRIVGIGGWVDYTGQSKPDFRIEDGDPPMVELEHISGMGGGIEIATNRTIVVRSAMPQQIRIMPEAQEGKLFLEDVVTHDLRVPKGYRVWARQLNVENEGTHITNEGQLWILGYKTERGGTLIDTRPGGSTEVLGGFSYTTTAGKLAPMFVNRDASVFTYFSEVCFNGDPFRVLIRETRCDQTRELETGKGSTLPYIGVRAAR